MSTMSPSAVVGELFDPVGRCLTPDVARRIAELRAAPSVQHRMDELAEKSSAGTLTPDECTELEARLRTINFISVLQAKARAVIAAETLS